MLQDKSLDNHLCLYPFLRRNLWILPNMTVTNLDSFIFHNMGMHSNGQILHIFQLKNQSNKSYDLNLQYYHNYYYELYIWRN